MIVLSDMSQKPAPKGQLPFVLIVVAVASVASIFVIVTLGAFRELQSDAPFFLSIASNLANGRGYINDHSPWPGIAATDRMPLWPLFVSLFLRTWPAGDPKLVIRIAGAAVHVMTAVLILQLSWTLTRQRYAGLLGGLGYALYPPALFLVHEAMSETMAAFLVAAALLAVSCRRIQFAALILGTSCLVRPNLAILPACIVVCAAFYWRSGFRQTFGTTVWTLSLFFAPITCWTVRNYRVTGHFPVVTTLAGSTLYGSNNTLVADDLTRWGYWTVPDDIPGETPRKELVARMSPWELDRYYKSRAATYIESSWLSLPRLMLGKFIRGHVPIPWKPSPAGYGAAACRLLLYVAVILTMRRWVSGVEPAYKLLIGALFLANLVTCLVFYGTARFTFVVEIATIPSAVLGVSNLLLSHRTCGGSAELTAAPGMEWKAGTAGRCI